MFSTRQKIVRHLPERIRGGSFHDFIGSGSPDHVQLWLRFYASDEDRAQHAQEWLDDVIPPKEKPPFNRDWRLPQAVF
jgi:hypothetical protein